MAGRSRGDGSGSRRGGSEGPSSAASKLQHLQDEAAQDWTTRDGVLEPSIPSPSSGYFDSGDDSDGGPKPSELYGKFTWKIEKFSEINKRELRSNVFEVGGYKWYILVYPQGCDVCNHLSLFLCVADYDKLLPGWSHFAQFTIAVVNKDPKKSKYSDTLHRFCKKEHDWGWKKFMELSKVLDGFTVADTLVIKAQVQVIRENSLRPFRCLDCQYRRELVRVYLTNVEGICRRFVEEKREKLGKLMEDANKWSNFRKFWASVEEGKRRKLAQEKMEVILKAVVKRFFNEKEVTSTLVMDALYSGSRSLDNSNQTSRRKAAITADEDLSAPVVWVDKECFVLAGDIMSLIERAAHESIPLYKDDKGPQNRTKDGVSDELGKDSAERDERRLTELGRRTVEMFVLAHLFSNRVEVAYREAVALMRQEELIREEEAAELADRELAERQKLQDRDKKSKRNKAKQKKKDRKEREEAEKPKAADDQGAVPSIGYGQNVSEQANVHARATDAAAQASGAASLSRAGLQAIPAGREVQEVFVRRENGVSRATAMDDSSSSCSTDSLASQSIPNGVVDASCNGNLAGEHLQPHKRSSASKGHELLLAASAERPTDTVGEPHGANLLENGCSTPEATHGTARRPAALDTNAVVFSLRSRVQWLEQRLQEKEEEVVALQEQLRLLQHQVSSSTAKTKEGPSPAHSSAVPSASGPASPNPAGSQDKKLSMPHSASAFVTTSRDRIINVGAAVSSGSSGADALRGSQAGESIQPRVVAVQEKGPIHYHQQPHTASHAPRAMSSAAVSQQPPLVGHASRSTSAGAGGPVTPALLSAVVPGRSKGHDGRFLRSGSTGPVKMAGEGGPSHSSALPQPSALLPSVTPAPSSASAGASLQRPASALGIPGGAGALSGGTHPGAPQQHAIPADASISGLLRSQSMSAAAAARPLHQSQQDGSAGSLSSGSLQSSTSYRGAMASSSSGGSGNQHGSGRRVGIVSPAASMTAALAGGGGGVSGGGGSSGSSTSSQSTSGAQYKQPSVASVATAGGEVGRPIASKAEVAVNMSAASSASPMRLAAAAGPSGADLKGALASASGGGEGPGEDFPHLALINYLLDEDRLWGGPQRSPGGYRPVPTPVVLSSGYEHGSSMAALHMYGGSAGGGRSRGVDNGKPVPSLEAAKDKGPPEESLRRQGEELVHQLPTSSQQQPQQPSPGQAHGEKLGGGVQAPVPGPPPSSSPLSRPAVPGHYWAPGGGSNGHAPGGLDSHGMYVQPLGQQRPPGSPVPYGTPNGYAGYSGGVVQHR
eukprot:SM000002S05725  [mRNA]  locus=s2:1806044:1813333:- [translate_table: standard]